MNKKNKYFTFQIYRDDGLTASSNSFANWLKILNEFDNRATWYYLIKKKQYIIKIPLKYSRFRASLRIISQLRLRHILYLIAYPFIKLKFYIIERRIHKRGEEYIKHILAKSIIKGRPLFPL